MFHSFPLSPPSHPTLMGIVLIYHQQCRISTRSTRFYTDFLTLQTTHCSTFSHYTMNKALPCCSSAPDADFTWLLYQIIYKNCYQSTGSRVRVLLLQSADTHAKVDESIPKSIQIIITTSSKQIQNFDPQLPLLPIQPHHSFVSAQSLTLSQV